MIYYVIGCDMIWYDKIYDMMIYDMIWYICQLQLGWHPVAVVQYTFTRKQYTEQRNETDYLERYIKIRIYNI
jgi:hypothetical protein